MTQLTIQEITSWYLYGQAEKPIDLADNNLIRDKDLVFKDLPEIDMGEFMTSGAGRYVTPGIFPLVQKFLSGQYNGNLVIGKEYSYSELLTRIIEVDRASDSYTNFIKGLKGENFDISILSEEKQKELDGLYQQAQGTLAVSSYNLDISSDDYAERSYVFGSMQFRLSDDTEFTIDADGNPQITNLRVVPVDDNFDFESRDGIAGTINTLIEPVIDPFKIGRKVELNFDKNTEKNIQAYNLTKDDLPILQQQAEIFNQQKSKILGIKTPNFSAFYQAFVDEILKSGVIDYIQDEKLVVFGTDEEDTALKNDLRQFIYLQSLKKLSTDTLLPFSSYILVKELNKWIDNQIDNLNKLGQIYVLGESKDIADGTYKSDELYGGKGEDELYGGDGADVLYGGNDLDKLYGGDGNDTLIVSGLSSEEIALDTFNNEAYGGDGNDYLIGANGDDHLEGGKDVDVLYGVGGNDTLKGEDGNDRLYGGNGDDQLYGGDGNDYIEDIEGNDTYYFEGNFGHDQIWDHDGQGTIKIDNVDISIGRNLSENTWEDSTQQYFIQKIEVEDNIQLVIHKKGSDKNSITILGFNDGDFGFSLKSHETEVSGSFNNTGLGTDVSDYIVGSQWYYNNLTRKFEKNINSGNLDTFFYIYSGGGNNTIKVDNLNYKIYLDTSATEEQIKDVNGLPTGLTFIQSQNVPIDILKNSNNTVTTGNGSNQIYGGLGSDQVTTGSGNDFIFLDSEVQATFSEKDLYAIHFSGLNGAEALPYNFEYDDTNHKITAKWWNSASTGAGQDIIVGGYASDTVIAGDDEDLLIGGGGQDFLFGGNAQDIIHGDSVVITNYAPKFSRFLTTDSSLDIERAKNPYAIDVEFFTGAYTIGANFAYHADDHLYGGNGNDIIFAEGGNDIVYGGNDDDVISGDRIRVVEVYNTTVVSTDGTEIIIMEVPQASINEVQTLAKKYLYEYAGDDILYGESGNDKIFGGYKNDYLYGGNGQDIIFGDSDIDNQYAIEKWNGFPTNQSSIYTYNWNFNPLNSSDRTDFYVTYVDQQNKPLWTADDYIEGGNGDDIIYGEEGKDIIDGGEGDDYIEGDIINLDGQYHDDDTIHGGDGKDTIWGQGAQDTIYGGEGDDYVEGDATNLDGQYHDDDILYGDEGNDTIKGDGGKDTIYGGEGDDNIEGDESSLEGQYQDDDVLYGDEGNDTLKGNGGKDTIYGGAGDDNIEGDESSLEGQYHSDDTLYGDEGNDAIWGNGGSDILYGGAGNDYLAGDQKDKRELDGNDKLYGGEGEDTLLGFDGDDFLDGGKGDDILFGGAGNDQIYSHAGNDLLSGGAGDDTYYISSRDAEVKILDSAGENHFYIQGNFDFSQVKLYQYTNAVSLITPTQSGDTNLSPEFKLTFFDDSPTQITDSGEILKDEYDNPVTGGYDQYLHFTTSTDYTIHLETYLKQRLGLSYQLWNASWNGIQAPYLIFSNGYIQNDQLIYQNSELGDQIDIAQIRENVSLYGQYQADEYHLLGGNDQATGSNTADFIYGGVGNDVISGNDGNDQLFGDEGNDTLNGGFGADALYGGSEDDQLFGDDGNDQLYGGTGNDELNGGTGDDQLFGDDGNDQLDGGVGNDQLDGGTGTDKLNGGEGDDILFGGAGDDQLLGNDGNDILDGGSGNDLLQGGVGLDTYVFDLTSGLDIIEDLDKNTIQLKGILPDQVHLNVIGSDLYIYYSQDQFITVKDFINLENIQKIQFDHEFWDLSSIKSKILIKQSGTSVDDTLTAILNFSNELTGYDGNDILRAGNTYSYLYGGEGNDVLSVTSSTGSLLDGGQGNDEYDIYSAKNVIIQDSDFTGKIYISGKNSYFKFNGNTIIEKPNTAASELISSNNQSFVYKYSTENKNILAIDYDASSGNLKFKQGNDTYFEFNNIYTQDDFYKIAQFDLVIGSYIYSVFNPNNNSSSMVEYLNTQTKLNTLIESVANAKITYSSLDDTIYGITRLGLDTIYAGDGNDHIDTGLGESLVYAENGNDYIIIQDILAKDEIYGGSGNDIIYNYNSNVINQNNYYPNDLIYAGSGDDQVYTKYQQALVYGGDGDDILTGSGQLYGDSGNDTLIAGDQGAYLDGGDGIDHLTGGMGDDVFIIGEFDTYEENDPNGGYDTIYIAQNFDLALNNFEAVTLLGDQNFNAYGDEFNNNLIGNDGNNILDGRTGSDYMEGGLGDDYYVIDTTDTIMTDEFGNSFIQEGDQVIENENSGIDTIERWQDSRYASYDSNGQLVLSNSYKQLEDNIENLVLKGNAKTAFGNELDNIIIGNSQDNYIDGLAGNDTYVFAKGGGTDTYNFEDDIDAVNTIKLEGYASSDVFAQKQGNSVYLSFKNSSDHIWLYNYYVSDTATTSYKVDQIIFDSGTTWTTADIDALVNRAATNHAPTVNAAIPTITANQGTNFSYKFANNVIVDQDSWDYLNYKITLTTKDSSGQYQSLPSWLTFDAATQTLTGTPPSSISGNLSFFYWGTDMYGYGTGTSFTLKINLPNHAPVVANSIADQNFTDAKAFSYTIASNAFTDADGDVLSYSATLEDGSALPTWLSFNATTRTLSGTSPENSPALNIKITAKDPSNQTVSDVFKLSFIIQNLTVNGTSSADTLYGGSGNDTITGQAGNDTLYGQSGNDTLNGGTGSDIMYGGKGDDTYIVDNTGDIVNENLNEGIDTVQSSVTYTLGNNLENLTLTGTSAINATGNALNNTLIGNSAVNTLTGGAGDDYLNGGAGNDKLLGGAGNDTYVVDSTGDVITENANEGIDTVLSSVTFTLGNNLENLTLTGTSAINATGNALSNTLIGNSANNILSGGAGNDILDGMAGNDQFTGGTGSDTLIYQLLLNSDKLGGNGSDTWSDFTVGNTTTNLNADKIDIGDLLVNYTGGYNSASLEPFIKTIVSGNNTQLYIDRDGGDTLYNSTLLLTLNNVNTNLNDLINNQQIII